MKQGSGAKYETQNAPFRLHHRVSEPRRRLQRAQVVLNKHIRHTRLIALELEAGEAPVTVLSIRALLAPTLKMAHQRFPARHCSSRCLSLRFANLPTGP